ncbi:hypothetical protein RI129_013119 [Pyrocoelia pectoralis]|uniref:Phospholipid scramblase n=1 Tax=Pyrocoelia pectoralis TaxID=417401 RepID=A0AAN7V8L1_9COLE
MEEYTQNEKREPPPPYSPNAPHEEVHYVPVIGIIEQPETGGSPYKPHTNAIPMSPHFTPIVPVPVMEQPQKGCSSPNSYINSIPMSPQIRAPCPPGLEFLTVLDQLRIAQTEQTLEVFTGGYQTANKYVIKNIMEEIVYYGKEESDYCARNCCGPRRKLQVKIVDPTCRPVISVKRRFACQTCLCPCWLQKIEVSIPPGVAIGYVEQNWNPFYPSFIIKDSTDEPIMSIKGPFSTSSGCCGRDVKFKIMSANGSVKMGKIYRHISGTAQDGVKEVDGVVVIFPMNLEECLKAILLGAAFLIDFMYFESTRNERRVQKASGAPSANYGYKCCSFTVRNGTSCCCCC